MFRIVLALFAVSTLLLGCGDEDEGNDSGNNGIISIADTGTPDMGPEDMSTPPFDMEFDANSPFPAVVIVPPELDIRVGQAAVLEAEYYDIDENRVFDATFTWTAEDPEIVTVDEFGTVTAQAAGFGRITVVSNLHPAQGEIEINVYAPHLDIAAGRAHSCALKTNGRVVCWGDNSRNQMASAVAAPALSPVGIYHFMDEAMVALAAGADHSCATDATGGFHCWGRNNAGQLGSLDTEPVAQGIRTSFPAAPEGESNAPVLGPNYSCIHLAAQGTLTCFGENPSRLLANNGTSPVLNPTRVHEDRPWKKVIAGNNHMCGLEEDLEIWCWGADDAAQLGPDGQGTSHEPVQVPGQFVDIFGGRDITCGLDFSQNLQCWGSSDAGFGDGVTYRSSSLVELDLMGAPASDFTAGEDFNCASGGGVTLCWGMNDHGQLGDDTLDDRTEAGPVRDSYSFREFAAGQNHICGVSNRGDNFCWGANGLGQVGDGTNIDRREPTFSSPTAN